MSLEVSIKKEWNSFQLDVAFQTDGQHLGVLGASGCGKSMTLKCIAGIETPDSGRIVLNGRTLFDSEQKINLKPQQRKVGYLFQNYALFPNMTILQNIRSILRLPKAQGIEKASQLLNQLHLDGLEDRYPNQLSGGQQQRAALARMLASEPELILLDEPFSALDTHLREQLQLQIAETLRPYRDVLLVTHSRDEAYKLCDSLMILSEGAPVVQGDTKALFRNPQKLEAARLTGCKNISKAEKTGEQELYASDWGIRLRTAEPVQPHITHVGIRAHDMHAETDENRSNAFPIRILETSEDPFEWTILFTANKSEAGGSLWWKISKQLYTGPPETLYFPPEALLLLTE